MNDLKLIENELVPVYKTDKGEKVVYGSELHSALGITTPYRTWIERRFLDCDATENTDYATVQICTVVGGMPKKEHIIKLDIAKEIAMLERNEKGKQVRRYFIQIEEKYKQSTIDRSQLPPEMQMFYNIADNQAKLFLEQKQQSERMNRIEERVDTMKSIMTDSIADWRLEINKMVREIANKSGKDYQALFTEMYAELERTARCSLKTLQNNKEKRMEKAGNTKTAIKTETTKIAIIEDKPQLRAIFENIVKRYAMAYCA